MTKTFTAEYCVTIGDINYGGHMGNDRPLVIFQDARIQMLDSFGYSEKDVGDHCGIIMVESGIKYLKEVFHHDRLTIEITVSELKTKKFTFDCRAVRQSDSTPVFKGFTSFLAFDYTDRKVVKLPEDFYSKLQEYTTLVETE